MGYETNNNVPIITTISKFEYDNLFTEFNVDFRLQCLTGHKTSMHIVDKVIQV